ncbi:MFS transporter [Actinomycetospora endophytica]|uniref:MFS transporter n=1 Tax=Actinomycetospora endophytica TaxID=2291215 RepID=A0ABS8PIT8_9PSEU|nr:MFS transporter [Actinomycetospora endophytica]MCD2198175.1 MFS transporter [Actinomycetospora endophytica]
MTTGWRLGLAGGAVMGVTFGMARYVYGLTLPAIRSALDVSEPVLGLIGSGTFAGFLLSLLTAPSLARRKGPRASTTLGGVSAAVGCALVAVAPSPGVLALGALVAGSAAGWVWASYSTIVAAVAAPRQRPRLLAGITTGAAAGLVVVGVIALVVDSWRWTWAVIAVASLVATVLNRCVVPRLPPAHARRRMRLGRGIAWPTGFGVVLFLGATAYFTYATDAAERAGLGAAAGPTIFVVVGAAGFTGLAAGALAQRAGATAVAVTALLLLGVALALLGLDAGSLPAVIVSAAVFGAANTVGSAALPIWTAALIPDDPAASFTATLLAGSVSAALTPAVIGALTPTTGLRVVLLGAAGLTAATAVVLRLSVRAPPGRRARGRT